MTDLNCLIFFVTCFLISLGSFLVSLIISWTSKKIEREKFSNKLNIIYNDYKMMIKFDFNFSNLIIISQKKLNLLIN